MTSLPPIETAFDAREDTPVGRDPDAHSPTLRRYHRLLWGRRLPNGRRFDLAESVPGRYLSHRSALGDFALSSDAFVPTFTRWRRLAPIVSRLPEHGHERFRRIAPTIGAAIIWPATPRPDRQTINTARGISPLIADRPDLTVECIRRHYAGGTSPLSAVLTANSDYFALFDHFPGFVAHFLLQDLVTASADAVRFLLPFDDFHSAGWPREVAG
ncbi:MAG TPA: hypothetical protein PKE32_08255, partial [Miltoncostaeaceae bacterium]|nr:hypothetical protein [Miltoncostaeaceae bacterium]